jgi:hypothetical protein
VIAVFATLNALFDAPVITPLLSNVNEMVLAEPPTVTDVILFDVANNAGDTRVKDTIESYYFLICLYNQKLLLLAIVLWHMFLYSLFSWVRQLEAKLRLQQAMLDRLGSLCCLDRME